MLAVCFTVAHQLCVDCLMCYVTVWARTYVDTHPFHARCAAAQASAKRRRAEALNAAANAASEQHCMRLMALIDVSARTG